MSEMTYIKVFLDWRESTRRLKDGEKGRLIDALVAYAKGEDPEPLMTGNEQYAFEGFRLQIDRDRALLEEEHERRSRAGTLGNQVRWGNRNVSQCDNSESQTSQGDSASRKHRKDKDKDKDKDEDKDEDEDEKVTNTPPHGGVQRGARFVPPTVDEVAEYCQERNNGIDPQYFVDYHEARGWVLSNGKPVKDWRACVRTWEARARERNKETTDQSSKWGIIGQMV